MKIRDLIKQLEDMLLIYGDRTILTITDIESEYSIKEIDGKMCAKYFEPSDHVAEVTIRIERNSSIKTLPSVTLKPEPCEDDKGCSNCMYSGRPTYKSPCSECRDNSQWEMKPISRSHENNTECEDTISRQEAIDALKGLPTWWADEGGFYGGAQPPMTALLDPEDAVSAIVNLPSVQPEQHWISVSERLPDEYGEYLVTKRTFGWNCEEYVSNDIAYFDNDGFHKADMVIAYMPLPEPYKTKENEL